ncbi:MAG: SpoIIE family protein phosphatase [Actinobacteria bacterium]|nr:SpoIIE family protein phosphatase [Actinomycetota bacterium]
MPSDDAAWDWLAPVDSDGESGEMVSMVKHFDWASTSLGPPETWGISLRMAVSTCLASRFPMLVVWGPDLIKIYNDGYRPMLGRQKHPAALGAPARDVWPEVWDYSGPRCEATKATRRPTWHEHEPLVLHRNGFPEECFFTFSYSPLVDDDGTVAGVLDVVTETTGQVKVERRLGCLTELNGSLFDAEQVTDVCVRAVTSLSGWASDVLDADIFLRAAGDLVLVASTRLDQVVPIGAELLNRVVRERQPAAVGVLHPVPDSPIEHLVLPLGSAHESVDGALVIALNPVCPYDDAYESFLRVIASTISSALEASYRRSVEIGEYRHISDTLQRAMLEPMSDSPTVAARYRPAARNLAVGGDWYDVMEFGNEQRALVVGDCVGHGLEAATAMSQLRSAARALLIEGHDPASTLSALDVFAGTIDGAGCATVAIAVIDRLNDTITYSRAGHPPPLVVGSSGAAWLDEATGLPLQVDPSRPRVNASRRISMGDMVVLYSDGLIERRTESLDAGLDRLRDAAVDLYGSSLQVFTDGLLRATLASPAQDDVVLVVKVLPEHS